MLFQILPNYIWSMDDGIYNVLSDYSTILFVNGEWHCWLAGFCFTVLPTAGDYVFEVDRSSLPN